MFTRRDLICAMGATVGTVMAGSASLFAATGRAPFSSARLTIAVAGRRDPNGRDVLLIPGLASGPDIWDGLTSHLSGHSLHLVHIAGFAGKPAGSNASGALLRPIADELARYIVERRLFAPAIIGHSMGGTLAMMIALQGAGAATRKANRIMVVDMLPAGAGMLGGTSDGLGYIAQQLNGYFTGTRAGRQILASMIAQTPAARDSDPLVIAQALTELARTDLTPRLPDLACPLSVVHALAAEPDVAAAQRRRYRAAYASARTAKITGIGPSGHMIMLDKPDKFAEAVRSFLA